MEATNGFQKPMGIVLRFSGGLRKAICGDCAALEQPARGFKELWENSIFCKK
jgi:hypothetical protein